MDDGSTHGGDMGREEGEEHRETTSWPPPPAVPPAAGTNKSSTTASSGSKAAKLMFTPLSKPHSGNKNASAAGESSQGPVFTPVDQNSGSKSKATFSAQNPLGGSSSVGKSHESASGKRRTLESASPPTSKKAKGGSQAESMGQIHTSPHGSVHPSSNRKAASTSASGSDVAMADLRVDPSFVKMIVEYSKVALLEEEREGKNAGSEPVRKTRHPLTGTFVRGLLSSEFDTFECLSAWVMDCLFLGFFSS